MNSIAGQDVSEPVIMLKNLLEYVVKTIVYKPEAVQIIAEFNVESGHLFSIKVDDRDLGRVIGKNGQTIKSIRSLVNAINPGLKDLTVDVSK